MKLTTLIVLLILKAFGPGSGYAQERVLTPAEQKAADMRLPDLDRSALEPEKR